MLLLYNFFIVINKINNFIFVMLVIIVYYLITFQLISLLKNVKT